MVEGLGSSFMEMEDKISLIGHCFGGTESLMCALSEKDEFDTGTDAASPRVILLLGGHHDDCTYVPVLEDVLGAAGSAWEITRHSNVKKGLSALILVSCVLL